MAELKKLVRERIAPFAMPDFIQVQLFTSTSNDFPSNIFYSFTCIDLELHAITINNFQESPNLPKTRSGKIMRRVLRKIAANDPNIGMLTKLSTIR